MDFTEHIIEYYDELYPVTDDRIAFFEAKLKDYPMPAKVLTIACGTGFFEHRAAKCGFDITGTGIRQEFIDSAVRRRRFPDAAVRFFKMTPLEIGRFLAKDFYHCVAVLEGAIYFIYDKTLLCKFFYDCRTVTVRGGRLIIHIPDILKEKESLRVRLISTIQNGTDSGTKLLTQTLERTGSNGSIKRTPVRSEVPVSLHTASELSNYAKEAGFKDAAFYKAWQSLPVPPEEADIAVFS